MIGSKDISEYLRWIDFCPYTIMGDNNGDKLNQVQSLFIWGLVPEEFNVWATVIYCTPKQVSEARDFYGKWNRVYPIDGIVISKRHANDVESNSYALKFETVDKPAVCETVVWNTGSTGKISPVAIFTEDIRLYGVDITRATAKNLKFVKENGVGPGAVVRITRANEVIPEIVRVTAPAPALLNIPLTCPRCGAPTEENETGVELMCSSPTCPARLVTQALKFTELCELEKGIGADTWLKYFDLHDILDLWSFFDHLLHGSMDRGATLSMAGESKTGKIEAAIAKMTDKVAQDRISVRELLISLNIPNLGEVHATTLGEYKLSELKTKLEDPQWNSKTNVLVEVELSLRMPEILHRVHNLDLVIKPTTKLTGVEICITGKLAYGSRAAFAKALAPFGFINKDSVTKKTAVLITNESSSSDKSKTAANLGTPVMTEQAFLAFYNITL
jgi:DNA ligase (NAD+)